jgi:Tol biopolymer transport system component
MQMHRSATRVTVRSCCVLALGIAAGACGDGSTSTRSPLVDTRLIAFVSDSDNFAGSSSIFTMHADGTHKSRLTTKNFLDDHPTWSPDGSSITFESNRQPGGVWIMNADGSNQRPLVVYPGFSGASELHWSPDGRSIAFVAFVDEVLVIMVADADGSHARRLTTNPKGELWPSWSPDGTQIAFMAISDSLVYSIFIVRADGSAQRQLTYGLDEQPEWSPDGTRIAFTNLNDNNTSQIFVVQADGSHRRALTIGDVNADPAWSPDGRQLAYDVFEIDSIPQRPLRIFRVNADGSDARAITLDRTTELPSFSSSWSPDWKPTP